MAYRAEHDSCQRFLELASGDIRDGVGTKFAAVNNIESVLDVEEEDTPLRKTRRSKWEVLMKKLHLYSCFS